MNFRHFLALLFGRWYQDHMFFFRADCPSAPDPFDIDPEGGRFRPWTLREFIRQFGDSSYLTDEFLFALLQLQKDDFLELFTMSTVGPEELVAYVALRALEGGFRDERPLPDDVSPWPDFRLWAFNGQRWVYSLVPGGYPSALAIFFAAHRNVELRAGEDGKQSLPPLERLWGGVLHRYTIEEVLWSQETFLAVLPNYPVYPDFQTGWDVEYQLFWDGWRIAIPECNLKFLDTLTEILTRLAAVSPTRPAELMPYYGIFYSYASLSRWFQDGCPDLRQWDEIYYGDGG